MNPPGTCASVPSFSGKLVAAYNDQPFVTDLPERIKDAKHFFDPGATQSERQAIIKKYGVKFVLLENVQTVDKKQLAAALRELGKLVYRNNRYILFSVDGN